MRPLNPIKFFDNAYIPEPNSGCWLWNRGLNAYGYGSISIGKKNEGAHRFSYKLHKGEVPQGKWVLHKCDVNSCVNPDHLFLGTAKENYDDMVAKGRKAKFDYAFAKLSPNDVADIRRLREEGHRVTAIAKQYGVSHSYISMATRGLRGDR